ncbi:hypothetical protein K1719_013157 [Acacia pycnantha]|nr:hypothetical protein K1719_013157 [Acacia pycnantha]
MVTDTAAFNPSEGAQNYRIASHHSYGYGGRGRGRGIGGPRPVTKLHYDFDFMAMNEKFNKDEVWGHLGKTKSHSKEKDGEDVSDEDDGQDGYNGEESKNEVKDDFFDTLSCNSLDHYPQNGRTRYSEQVKIDTETFGDFVRPRGGRGGRGLLRGGGGRSRGGYYGQWVEKQDRQICELRSALNAHISDTELRILVDGIMNHYSHLFRMKSVCKSGCFLCLVWYVENNGERFFLWIGGFRPSELLKVLVPLIEPLTEQQRMDVYNLGQSC